jgi:hypothetical protein
MSTPLAWYLIRTKRSREQYVHEELSRRPARSLSANVKAASVNDFVDEARL